MNPYEILGVERSASDAEIRLAYLSLARSLHPDAAGPESTAAFQRLQAAYDILKDPEKKTFYDQTGMVMGENMDQGRIISTAAEALEQVLMNMGDDPTIDLIMEAIKLLGQFKASAPGAKKDLDRKQRKYETLIKRLKKKNGENGPILFLFQRKIKELDHQRAAIDQELDQVEKAIVLLREYQYQTDPKNPIKPFRGMGIHVHSWSDNPGLDSVMQDMLDRMVRDTMRGKKR